MSVAKEGQPPSLQCPFIAPSIEQMMDVVELTNLRDALIGMPGSTGLSVEQRKVGTAVHSCPQLSSSQLSLKESLMEEVAC